MDLNMFGPGGSEQGNYCFVFKWNGEYAGFFKDEWLFDATGRYLGWRDARHYVWKYDGGWLGQVIETNYILRDRQILAQRQIPRVPPVPVRPPRPPAPRVARVPRPNCSDPLEEWLRMPTFEELVGEWRSESEHFRLGADGIFRWAAPEVAATADGRWELRERTLVTQWEEVEEPERSYWIIEFADDSILLRWMRKEGRSLPFRLHRVVPIERPDTGSISDESQAT